jgi:hypothetical protein
LRVEAGTGFIQKQNGGMMRNGARDQQSLRQST